MKQLILEHTETVHTIIKHQSTVITQLKISGYYEIKPFQLPNKCDALTLESFSEFPLHIIRYKIIKSLHLYCDIEKTKDNFEILYELDLKHCDIHFHRNEKNLLQWFNLSKRIATIKSIVD